MAVRVREMERTRQGLAKVLALCTHCCHVFDDCTSRRYPEKVCHGWASGFASEVPLRTKGKGGGGHPWRGRKNISLDITQLFGVSVIYRSPNICRRRPKGNRIPSLWTPFNDVFHFPRSFLENLFFSSPFAYFPMENFLLSLFPWPTQLNGKPDALCESHSIIITLLLCVINSF